MANDADSDVEKRERSESGKYPGERERQGHDPNVGALIDNENEQRERNAPAKVSAHGPYYGRPNREAVVRMKSERVAQTPQE